MGIAEKFDTVTRGVRREGLQTKELIAVQGDYFVRGSREVNDEAHLLDISVFILHSNLAKEEKRVIAPLVSGAPRHRVAGHEGGWGEK